MEKFRDITWESIYIITFIFLLSFFFRSNKINSFVKGLFITSLIFRVITGIFEILMYHISIEDVRKIFGWEGNLKFIPDFFAYSSYILIIYGISFFVGKDFTILNEQKEYPNMLGKRRNIGISLLLFVITLGIYFPFWLFRTVKDLKTNFDEEIPYTPGKAVGYLFIPLINFVWVFYILFSLPLRIKQIESKFYNRNIGFYFHPVFYSVLLILFSLLNELSFFTKFDKSTYGYILSFYSITIVIWLTIQAKLNSFYDFKDEQINSILKA